MLNKLQKLHSFVLLIVCIIRLIEADDEIKKKPAIKEENNVMIMTRHNFEELIISVESGMVNIYTDRCYRCHEVMPEYEKAAAILKDSIPSVEFIKLEAHDEPELATAFGADKYPKLKAFKHGNFWEYEGEYTTAAIVEYMKQVSSPDFVIPKETVLTLTAENFTEIVNHQRLMLVEFYAPWCTHCQKLTPIYEKAARKLKSRSTPIPLARVDATANKDLAKEYNVKAFPDLRVFRFGKDSPYGGSWETIEGIVEYMEKQVGDASHEQTSIEDVQHAMSDDQATIVGFFDSSSSPLFKLYTELTNKLRDDYLFYHTFNSSVTRHFGVKPNTVVLFHAPRFHSVHEPSRFEFLIPPDSTDTENLQVFFYRNHNPLVGQFTKKTAVNRYLMRPLVLFFYTVDFSSEGARTTQFWRKRIVEIAKDYNQFNTTFAIINEEDFPELVADFGIEESGEVVNVGILGKGNKRYMMEPMEEWNPNLIRKFISNYHQGKLKPHIKSQPAPSKNYGLVKVVVGSTFEKIVLDPLKDVLVEIYSPKCEMCKTLEPIYRQLAAKFRNVKDLVIAKVDGSANELPEEYRTRMMPVIFFVPRTTEGKASSPIKYEGGAYSIEALENFLRKHATVDLDSDLRGSEDKQTKTEL